MELLGRLRAGSPVVRAVRHVFAKRQRVSQRARRPCGRPDGSAAEWSWELIGPRVCGALRQHWSPAGRSATIRTIAARWGVPRRWIARPQWTRLRLAAAQRHRQSTNAKSDCTPRRRTGQRDTLRHAKSADPWHSPARFSRAALRSSTSFLVSIRADAAGTYSRFAHSSTDCPAGISGTDWDEKKGKTGGNRGNGEVAEGHNAERSNQGTAKDAKEGEKGTANER